MECVQSWIVYTVYTHQCVFIEMFVPLKDYNHCDLTLSMNPIPFHRDVHNQARCIPKIELFIEIFIDWLVVSNIFYFPFHIWDVILPIDELIFFKMVIAPPTSIYYS
jgi:hypothetical protein